jgi:hypothetical protein
MPRSSAEVIAGVGLLYAGPLATTAPTNATTALNAGFREIGYTDKGATISSEVTVEEIEVAEELAPIKFVQGKRTAKIAFEMAQTSIENLALALNLGAAFDPTATTVSPPDAGEELSISIVLQTEQGARWYFPSAKNGAAFELARQKTGKTLIGVEFNVEKLALKELFYVWPNTDGLI